MACRFIYHDITIRGSDLVGVVLNDYWRLGAALPASLYLVPRLGLSFDDLREKRIELCFLHFHIVMIT